jgi:hypothetical protein
MTSKKPTFLDKKRKLDEKLDRALEDTFPASDPVSITEPSPNESSDSGHDKDRKSKAGRKS